MEKLVQSEDSGVFWLDMGAEGAELTQLLGCCLVNPSIFCPCDTQQNRHGFRWLDVVILGMNEGKIVREVANAGPFKNYFKIKLAQKLLIIMNVDFFLD